MKIAILRKKYSFHGGAESDSHNLAMELSDAGHEVHIFAMKWKGSSAGKVFFHKVPCPAFNSTLRDLCFVLSSFFMLRRRRRDFDIIQSHDKTLFQDIYRAGDGCHIEWLRQRWKRSGFAARASVVLNPYHWMILLLERIIFMHRRYLKIIAISGMGKREIEVNYRVPSEDIEVIYNEVDLTRFHPRNRDTQRTNLREAFGLSEADFLVLFVGSGFERKGVKYLLQAVECIRRPVVVMIAGKGKESEYRKFIKNQRVIFCGPREGIEKYYAAADVFVLPALYEPFGNVILEALASGLPVITTRYCGGAELITEGETGFVVSEPDDVGTIAEKIELLFDEERRSSMGGNARLLAEGFTHEKYISEILGLYKRIVSR